MPNFRNWGAWEMDLANISCLAIESAAQSADKILIESLDKNHGRQLLRS